MPIPEYALGGAKRKKSLNPMPNLPDSSPISRRSALKILTATTILSALGYFRFSKPHPSIYQPDTLTLPQYLQSPKSVVVIGAGLAGLTCAYELSRRGFQVTLLERSSNLGGKIASWEIEAAGQTFRMEHGFHGFFPQYYNLNRIAEELSIRDNFRSLDFYSVLFRDQKYSPENFYPSHSAFPWNILDLAVWSSNRLRWGINLLKPAHWKVFREIGGFRMPESYGRLDGISVSQWAEHDFPQGLFDLYFLPFAKSTLNAPDLLSAGELMQFFHFYFFGNPEGLAFNGTKDDMGTSLVQPIAQSIEDHNGKILTQAHVSQIDCQSGKISGLTYQQGSQETSAPFWVEVNALGDADNDYFGAGDRVFYLSTNSKEALSLTCTHQGCTVTRQTDGTFLCPCHGARYSKSGKVLQGPAKQSLARYRVRQRQEHKVQLSAVAAPLSPQKLAADYYVIAADVPGVQQLFSLTVGESGTGIKEQIEQLAIADPFAVARFWFDQDFPWQYSDFTSLSGYRLTDSIALYHHIQQQFIDWAAQTGGSVVELHAYGYKERDFPTQEALLTTFTEELYEIVPSLKQARLIHQELVNQKNFSGYPPDSYPNRPETQSAIPNLFFAGDWVKMPFPCGLMERAVSSGLIAANEIMAKEGLQRRELLSVKPEGLLTI